MRRRAEIGNQQHKNIKMNDSIHQIPQLRMDPTFSESSSDRSNTTPSSSNNKRKARSKSKGDKANEEAATQQRRCRIITILLSFIPFVLSLAALLIVLTKDKEDTRTTISAASAILDETDHQIQHVSNTQSQIMSMQPNDSHSNNDEADDSLPYDEVRMNVFTTVHLNFQSKSFASCHFRSQTSLLSLLLLQT